MTTKKEREVLELLDSAENKEEILDSIDELRGAKQTVTSYTIVTAAGTMLANELERSESS